MESALRNARKRVLATFVAGAVMAVTITIAPRAAYADDNTTTATEVAAALDKVDAINATLVASAAPSTTDGDSTAQTATVDIPADPTKGVKLTDDNGQTITIGLPNATQSGKGAKTSRGAVAYSSKDSSANAVIPTAEGGVQFLITIEGKKAPTEYNYPISMPDGDKIELLQNGWAAIVNADGSATGIFVSPVWAKDANGKAVKSWFTTDGKTLTQHIAHKGSGVTYPVVADPSVGDILWAVVRCGAGGWLGWVAAAFTPYGILLRALTVAASCVTAL